MEIGKVNKKGKWHLLSTIGQSQCLSVRNKEWLEIKKVEFLPNNLCSSCWESLLDEAIEYEISKIPK